MPRLKLALVFLSGSILACGGGGPTPSAPVTEEQTTEPPGAAPEGAAEPATVEPASGGPDGPGELPMSEVQANMADVTAAIKKCADATTYEGKVAVRVTIAADGSASAVVEQSSGQADIDECMTGPFTRARFPSSERGQRFLYSYTF